MKTFLSSIHSTAWSFFIIPLAISLCILLIILLLTITITIIFIKNQFNSVSSDKLDEGNHKIKLYRFSDALANTLISLSSDRTGTLIVIQKKDDISGFKYNGFEMKAKFSPEFCILIFSNKKSPFHDGAMLISDFNIIAVSSYLPMTKKLVDVRYGARHRAALGISEINDSISFVVSETSGLISYSQYGELHHLPQKHNDLALEIRKILEYDK
ncbi:MAG: diadenylate cyclase [Mycoplasmoidaceae bacterium]